VGDGCEWRSAVGLGGAKRRAVTRGLLTSARGAASHMAGAGGTNRQAASLLLEGGKQNCHAHGGGRRCQKEGCAKAARPNAQHCIAHGGGKRCQEEDCTKSACGDTGYCVAHGGGRRCQHDGCFKQVGCRRHGALVWRQAGEGAASRSAAPWQPPKAARRTAWRMAGAGAASRLAAPRQLLEAARCAARRMAEAGGVKRRAVPSHAAGPR
jgi:hypothetical protein